MAMKVPGGVLAEYPDLFALILVLLLTGEFPFYFTKRFQGFSFDSKDLGK